MRLLLDTHIFLWYVLDDPQLPVSFRTTIRDTADEVYLSAASVWEAVIKHALGKLVLPAPAAEYLPAQRAAHAMDTLPIDEQSVAGVALLPPLHRDPFDRVLIAQAIRHELKLVTVDNAIRRYSVPLLDPR